MGERSAHAFSTRATLYRVVLELVPNIYVKEDFNDYEELNIIGKNIIAIYSNMAEMSKHCAKQKKVDRKVKIHQRSGNYSSWVPFGLLYIFVNKVVLKQPHSGQ